MMTLQFKLQPQMYLLEFLQHFWDAIPTNNIQIIINHIIAELVSGKTSSSVQASKVTSITSLLNSPQLP
eukprot:2200890-Ditylum_brightwellii.AAC.1